MRSSSPTGGRRAWAYLVENGTILDGVSSDEGVSALQQGQHRDVFLRRCGPWLEAEPQAPVLLVGMVGSREGWVVAPYAECPADAAEIARAMVSIDLEDGRQAHIVPGLFCEPAPGAADVMRGEETLVLGAGSRTASSACRARTRNGSSCAAGGSSASPPT